MGAGLAGLDGLDAGAAVTAEQMRLLFGSGHHPLATERLEALGPDATEAQRRAAVRLGTPFKVYSPTEDVTLFRREVARRFEEHNVAAGLPRDHPIDIDDRARIRTEVARSLFRAEHGRDPANAREISATIAKHSRPRTSAVAGYDLTFTPAKSVSALWAVAPPTIRHQIEAAHDDAVADALAYLERNALFTRTGSNGVRQVDVRGAIATAFVHRDSRAGDPNLHTHLAVANKVQTLDGRWLSIDGRVLYAAAVSASETYNTRLEQHLTDRAGLVFTDRANSDLRKRPTREVAGVDERLTQRWSSRRLAIEARQSELAARFHTTHARPPSEAEARDLAQQATLETREAKKAPRSRAEQFAQWHAEAVDVLGEDGLARMLTRMPQAQRPSVIDVDDAWVASTAAAALGEVQARRAHWNVWHVRAEALRRVRTAGLPTGLIEPTVDRIVDHALAVGSVPLNSPDDAITEPPELRRRDGASVYTVAGAATYTSLAVLHAEARLVQAAARRDGHRAGSEHVDLALLAETANGVTLNTAQTALVRSMASSGANVQLAIAPAGTGKTTAMRALAAAWRESGGIVLGLAPSAAAADVLAQQARLPAETLAKLDWDLTHQPDSGLAATIGPRHSGAHRRGRHGRHPHPGPGRGPRPEPRRQRPPRRRRPAAGGHRGRRRAARHRHQSRRATPGRAGAIHRPGRSRRHPRPTPGPHRSPRVLPRPPPRPRRRPAHPHRRRLHILGRRPRPGARLDHARPHPRPGRRAQPARPRPPPRPAPPPPPAPPTSPTATRPRSARRSSAAPTTAPCGSRRPTGSRTATAGRSSTSPVTAHCASSAPATGCTPPSPPTTCASRSSSATPPPPTPPKACPPTPCTGSAPGASPASSCTRC